MALNYNIRDLQLKSVGLLAALDQVCREHGLRYYMVYGTLLGAVREGGFIPWDDDMDVGLLREDYDVLMQHADEWLPAPYRIVNHRNDPDYPKYFAKIEDTSTTLIENRALGYVGGIYMDVFAFDAVPDNALLRFLHYHRFNLCKRLLYLMYRNPYKHGHGVSSWMPRLAQWLFKKEQVHRWTQRAAQAWNGHTHCSMTTTYDDGLRVFPRSIFGQPQRMKFESIEANAPEDSHEFLLRMYGDNYMTPPPLEQRTSHSHDYLDLEHSFLNL